MVVHPFTQDATGFVEGLVSFRWILTVLVHFDGEADPRYSEPMKPPSTHWKEQISAEESQRFAAQAQRIQAAHALKNAVHGKGRFLHRKPLLAAKATLTVYDNLPEPARQGLFREPQVFQSLVRFSHGSFDLQANSKPDIRGFAVKVQGVEGPGSLGGTTDHQDFLFINHNEFASRSSEDFLELTLAAAAKGEAGLLWYLIRRYGLGEGLKRIQLLLATLRKPFAGYNAETFSTAVPVAWGPYAGKVRLQPLAPVKARQEDGADLAAQLAAGPLSYEVAVQLYVDEESTPLENPPAVWSQEASPFVPVAKLTLKEAAGDVEGLKFDPWGGLEAHRPLGEIMRARKGAYYASQKAR